MADYKDMMAKKVQAAARGYIARKTGMGGKKKRPTNHAGGKQKPGAKKAKKKDDDVQAMVIQAAFRKYKEYQKKN